MALQLFTEEVVSLEVLEVRKLRGLQNSSLHSRRIEAHVSASCTAESLAAPGLWFAEAGHRIQNSYMVIRMLICVAALLH